MYDICGYDGDAWRVMADGGGCTGELLAWERFGERLLFSIAWEKEGRWKGGVVKTGYKSDCTTLGYVHDMKEMERVNGFWSDLRTGKGGKSRVLCVCGWPDVWMDERVDGYAIYYV